MKNAGDSDLIYIASRRVLLDALEAIERHLDSLILVGAQAIYLQTGEADLAVSPYTTDGDIAIDPTKLKSEPLIQESMTSGGFSLKEGSVGIWQKSVGIEGVPEELSVDLLVPQILAGKGRRAARIPPHAKLSARKVLGLEGALVDRDVFTIEPLDSSDKRQFELLVAGPAALIVAKVFKIMDRESDFDRISNKDALDLYRLLRGTTTVDLVVRFNALTSNSLSSQVTDTAIRQLPILFGKVDSVGTQMAVDAAVPLEDGDTLAASLVVLIEDLLHQLN